MKFVTSDEKKEEERERRQNELHEYIEELLSAKIEKGRLIGKDKFINEALNLAGNSPMAKALRDLADKRKEEATYVVNVTKERAYSDVAATSEQLHGLALRQAQANAKHVARIRDSTAGSEMTTHPSKNKTEKATTPLMTQRDGKRPTNPIF